MWKMSFSVSQKTAAETRVLYMHSAKRVQLQHPKLVHIYIYKHFYVPYATEILTCCVLYACDVTYQTFSAKWVHLLLTQPFCFVLYVYFPQLGLRKTNTPRWKPYQERTGNNSLEWVVKLRVFALHVGIFHHKEISVNDEHRINQKSQEHDKVGACNKKFKVKIMAKKTLVLSPEHS